MGGFRNLDGSDGASPARGDSDVETETVSVVSQAAVFDAPAATGGARGWRYVVLEEVGRGGMGRVQRAYDPKLEREVALKEVRRDMLNQQSTLRLVGEARAMAKLSHPNVVAVYDVEEVNAGEVVLVMEWVAGQTLKQWLRETDRDWRPVVHRFIHAGRGLAAAHEAGLLHRDFKPANVMVTREGAVKVTDFGLAKVTGDDSTLDSISDPSSVSRDGLTETGSIMGTPRYMAPEQHRPRSPSRKDRALTAAADQYAYCVALWEALTGAPPFSGKGMVEAKEGGPPQWPAANVPRPIADAVIRGLSTLPEDRWPSMQALLQALSWDPAKRRNRWLLGLGSVGALGLANATWTSLADAQRARCTGGADQLAGVWDDPTKAEVEQSILGIGRSYAPQIWKRTHQSLDRYVVDWTAMHTEACEATAVRGQQSSAAMDLRMACLHRAAVELQAVTAQLADADADVAHNAHKLTGGLPPLSRCADVEALQQDVEPPLSHEAEAVEGIRVLLAKAKVEQEAGRYGEAKHTVEVAKAAAASVEYGPVHTEVALAEGMSLQGLGEYAAAEATLTRALELASQWGQMDRMREAAVKLMAVVGGYRRKTEAGLQHIALARGLAHGDALAEAGVANTVANILKSQGKLEDAEAEHRRALALRETTLGPAHPLVAVSRNNLATVLAAQGNFEDAEAEYRGALALSETALGPEHPHVAASRNNLAAVLQAQGKLEDAEAEHRRALALREAALGPEHPHVAASRNNLSNVLEAQGKYEEAEAESQHALVLLEAALGPEHPHVATARHNLADLLLEKRSRPHEALDHAELAWSRRQRDDVPPHRRAQTAFLLARALWATRKTAADTSRARTLAERALEAYSEAESSQERDIAPVRDWLQTHPLP